MNENSVVKQQLISFFRPDVEFGETDEENEKFRWDVTILFAIQLNTGSSAIPAINNLLWERAVSHCYLAPVVGEENVGCIGFPTPNDSGGKFIQSYEEHDQQTEVAIQIINTIRRLGKHMVLNLENGPTAELRKRALKLAAAVTHIPVLQADKDELVDSIFAHMQSMAVKASEADRILSTLRHVFLSRIAMPNIKDTLKRFHQELPSWVDDERTITFQNGLLAWDNEGNSRFFETTWAWRMKGGLSVNYNPKFSLIEKLKEGEVVDAYKYGLVEELTLQLPYTAKLLSGAYPDGVGTWLPWMAMLGYLFTPKNPLRKIFVLNGKSTSGKSVITKVWQKILADKSISSEFDSFLSRHGKARDSLGKYVVFFPETGEALSKNGARGHRGAWEFLKQWSGGDQVNLGELYKQDIVAVMHSKPVFISNEFPQFGDDDSGALEERVVVFHHLNSVDKQDRITDLADRIANEEIEGLATIAASTLVVHWPRLSVLWHDEIKASSSLSVGQEQLHDSVPLSTAIVCKKLFAKPTKDVHVIPMQFLWMIVNDINTRLNITNLKPKRLNRYPLELMREVQAIDIRYKPDRVTELNWQPFKEVVRIALSREGLKEFDVPLRDLLREYREYTGPNSNLEMQVLFVDQDLRKFVV